MVKVCGATASVPLILTIIVWRRAHFVLVQLPTTTPRRVTLHSISTTADPEVSVQDPNVVLDSGTNLPGATKANGVRVSRHKGGDGAPSSRAL